MISGLRALRFFGLALLLTGAAHAYLWARLVRDPAWGVPWQELGTAVLAALGLAVAGALVLRRLLPREVVAPLRWFVLLWLGPMLLMLTLLMLAEPLRLGTRLWTAGASLGTYGPLLTLSRGVAAGILLATAVLTGSAVASALGPVRVKRVRVALRGLATGLDGFRIVQLSDVHVGGRIDRAFLERVVEQVNALEPDAVAVTGDLVDGSVARLGWHVEPLARLRARHGVYVVTGNHEYHSGAHEWIPFLRGLGLRVLANERVTLEHGGAKLDIAGVHDRAGARFGQPPDLARALRGREPGRPVVLLAHQPVQVHEAAEHEVDLQLSGHTHGGQIFPFGYLVRLQQPYVSGLHDHRGTQIYVSNGTGHWGPPMRLGAPPEIACVELTRAGAAGI